MILEGDSSVIDALKEKKRLMDAGEPHEHIRPMLVCGSGCMKGAYAWGAGLALAENGYQDCFHTIAGVSVGALTGAYLVSGNIRDVESLPYIESCSTDFFSFKRPFNVLGTRYMRSVLEDYPGRGLDTEAVLSHPTRLQIGVSDFETAQPMLLEPASAEEVYEGLRATISMPGAVSDPVFIRGKRYVDGASTIPFVRQIIYQQSEPTHIIDIPNQEEEMANYSYLEAFLLATVYRRRISPALRRAANGRRHNRRQFFQELTEYARVPTCLMWGDNSVGSFEANPEKMKRAIEHARSTWDQLLR